ncbi:hypothetical protein KUCAC02_013050, partial [Chaenocephalus aceratus]
GGKGLYMQLNATAPILAVYANPEACLKKDFRVNLAHGLSLSVVGSAFGIPKSTVHRIIKHVTGKIK